MPSKTQFAGFCACIAMVGENQPASFCLPLQCCAASASNLQRQKAHIRASLSFAIGFAQRFVVLGTVRSIRITPRRLFAWASRSIWDAAARSSAMSEGHCGEYSKRGGEESLVAMARRTLVRVLTWTETSQVASRRLRASCPSPYVGLHTFPSRLDARCADPGTSHRDLRQCEPLNE